MRKKRKWENAQHCQFFLQIFGEMCITALEGNGKGDMMSRQSATVRAGKFILPVTQESLHRHGTYIILPRQQRDRQRVSICGALHSERKIHMSARVFLCLHAVLKKQFHASLIAQAV